MSSHWECIQARRRTQGGRVIVEGWHIVAGPAEDDATWRPIMCGGGVVFPGNSQIREATCDACVTAAIAAGTHTWRAYEGNVKPLRIVESRSEDVS